jgi:hypothetical protein
MHIISYETTFCEACIVAPLSFFLPLCSTHYLNALLSNTLKCMFLPEREKPSFTPTYHKTARQENMGKWKHKRNFKQPVVRCRNGFRYTF